MMFCFWFRKTNKLLRKDLDTKERKENNVKINRVSFYWAIQNLELGSFKYYLVDYLYWNIKVLKIMITMLTSFLNFLLCFFLLDKLVNNSKAGVLYGVK